MGSLSDSSPATMPTGMVMMASQFGSMDESNTDMPLTSCRKVGYMPLMFTRYR